MARRRRKAHRIRCVDAGHVVQGGLTVSSNDSLASYRNVRRHEVVVGAESVEFETQAEVIERTLNVFNTVHLHCRQRELKKLVDIGRIELNLSSPRRGRTLVGFEALLLIYTVVSHSVDLVGRRRRGRRIHSLSKIQA